MRLVADPSSFNFSSASSSCFSASSFQPPELPPGAMDLSPCCEGAPLVASFPHFLHADGWYARQAPELTPASSSPSRHQHEFYVSLDPELGVPVSAQVRFQLNLHLRRDAAFPPLSRLPKTPVVLPLLWAQEGFDSLGGWRVAMLKMALAAPVVIEGATMALMFMPGKIMRQAKQTRYFPLFL